MIRLLLAVLYLLVAACAREPGTPDDVTTTVSEALGKLGLDETSLSVPRLGQPYSIPGRLPAVDDAMKRPLTMIALSRRLTQTEPAQSMADYLSRLLGTLDSTLVPPPPDTARGPDAKKVWTELMAASSEPPTVGALGDGVGEMPVAWRRDTPLSRTLRRLFSTAAALRREYEKAGGRPTAEEWEAIKDHLTTFAYSAKLKPEAHRFGMPEYHAIGARTDSAALANMVPRLLAAVERVAPDLLRAAAAMAPSAFPMEWDTPLGRVRVAGTGADHHHGDFLLLIDLGGDDLYEDVGRALKPGQVSMVIDLAGNDTVRWEQVPGPGAGIMGIGLWADLSGDDRYIGRNLGLGTGLSGAGLLWDADGNDVYKGGSRVQGTGQYGIGLLLDGAGNDSYEANLNSQGYAGSGGYGIQVDLEGDDSYTCSPLVPDQAEARTQRHHGTHYISLCQGYTYGRREEEISGGVGLLLDRQGNDRYRADLFAQGGAYWFGLGMLVDGNGSDRYEAFEHCQGESLHLGAGFLGDWGGDDEYIGYEHCQGVGIDRAVGLLYDASGNDRYRSHHQSQGAGIKPYGVGLLIDAAGDDHFAAANTSQGYSARPPEGFPEHQWPLGILLDLSGTDVFDQPGVAAPTPDGRVYNRQGIAVDR